MFIFGWYIKGECHSFRSYLLDACKIGEENFSSKSLWLSLWQDKGNMAKKDVIGMEVSDVDTNKDGEVRNDCETFQVYASVSAEHKAKKR